MLEQAGADSLHVGDLSGTDLRFVEARISNVPGTPMTDRQADRVVVDATGTADALMLTGSAGPASGTVTATGAATKITLTSVEGDQDLLTINGLDGDDSLDASGLAPGIIGLTFNE